MAGTVLRAAKVTVSEGRGGDTGSEGEADTDGGDDSEGGARGGGDDGDGE